MRTYGKADWDSAQDAWAQGDFASEWRDVRHRAAMRGMLYPPDGTKWDSWEDDSPSQRAMLIRALRETPALLFRAIEQSRSWFQVIAYITRQRDDWRHDAELRIRDDERRHREEQPDHIESAKSLAAIMRRIADSQ